MTPRRAVLGGLLAGVLAGAALLAVAVAVAPVDVPVSAPGTPEAPVGSASPGSSPSSSPTPPAAVEASPSGDPLASSPPSGSPPSGSPPPSAAAGDEFMIGAPAPAIALPQLGGGTIDLVTLRGRPVWVTFMATWCPSCREELPRMALAAARYADDGLVVLAVDVAEDEGTVAAYFGSLGVSIPVALDADGATMRRWRVLALPVHFWIDRDGIIRFGALGGVGPDVFAEGLGTILPGVTVEP
ncbi:MAG TPA: TlpA disulfide reductase family protein [Candidatus Binatia bacterium]|nr:TlpA disulfide reductase family protein [Candidatus Binatia bacterium]